MQGGQRIGPPRPISVARERLAADLEALPETAKRIRDPEAPLAVLSARPQQLTDAIQSRLQHPHEGPGVPAS
jgi:nicotinate phosphoribosyltransferase